MKFFIVLACALAVASASHLVAPVVPAVAVHHHHPGPQHLPVIGPNGVPIDTPAVQHAKAAHLAHKVEAHARNGDYAVVAHAPIAHHAYAHHAVAPVEHHHHAIAPVAHHVVAEGAYDHHDYHHHHHGVVAHGVVPAAHTYASGWQHGIHGVHHGIVAHQPAAYPTTAVHPSNVNGVPLETPEVVAAKSHHFAAHAEALSRTGHVAHGGHGAYHHLFRRQVYATPYGYPAYTGIHAYHTGYPLVY